MRPARENDFPKSVDNANLKDKVDEFMRIDIGERAAELKRIESTLPEHLYESQKKGISNSLKCTVPGGSSEI